MEEMSKTKQVIFLFLSQLYFHHKCNFTLFITLSYFYLLQLVKLST